MLDASVAVKLVVEEPDSESAVAIIDAHADRVAPDLLTIEVASALAKKVRFAGLPRAAAEESLRSLAPFVTEFLETFDHLDRAMTLSVEMDHSLFDCIYLAAALDRDCAVVTADRKFANAAAAAGYVDRVRLLGNG